MTPTQTELRHVSLSRTSPNVERLFASCSHEAVPSAEFIDAVTDAPPSKTPKRSGPTASCIRDNMTVPTLCVLIEHNFHPDWVRHTCDAIRDPDSYATGRRGISSAEHLNIKPAFDHLYATPSTATSETSMSAQPQSMRLTTHVSTDCRRRQSGQIWRPQPTPTRQGCQGTRVGT